MTKLAELSVLGIYAPLHFFEYYHDDGYVDSIEDHFFMLVEKYGQEHQVSRDKIRKTLGGYLHYEGMFFSHHHIYYKRVNEPDIFFIRGHEETHFLERIWKLNLLEDKLKPFTNRTIDFGEVIDSESRCNIGGVYALIKNNVPIKEVFEIIKSRSQQNLLKNYLEKYGLI